MSARRPDPTALLDTLDPPAIIARLEELDGETRALRVLLRAARARQRGQRQTTSDQRQQRQGVRR